MIYATQGGKFITEVRRSWGDSEPEYKSAVHYNSHRALDWLKADNNDSLGRASKDAWTQACRIWPDLSAEETEVVE